MQLRPGRQNVGWYLDEENMEYVALDLDFYRLRASAPWPRTWVAMLRVAERSGKIRADRCRLLRGFFHGRERVHYRDRLRVITIPPGAYAVGHTLKELRLKRYRVSVTTVRRHGIRGSDPDPNLRLQGQNALIVRGEPEALFCFENHLLTSHGSD